MYTVCPNSADACWITQHGPGPHHASSVCRSCQIRSRPSWEHSDNLDVLYEQHLTPVALLQGGFTTSTCP